MDRRERAHRPRAAYSHFINHHLYLGTEKSAPGENDGGYLKEERERERERERVAWRSSGGRF